MNNVSKAPASSEKKSTGKAAGAKSRVNPSSMTATKSPTAPRKPVSRNIIAKGRTQAAPQITEDQRREMIARAAYLRAEQRGFTGGDPTSDWLAAEAEIAQSLNKRR